MTRFDRTSRGKPFWAAEMLAGASWRMWGGRDLEEGRVVAASDVKLYSLTEDPEQRIDTAGSAGIACALARCANRGWIDASYRDRAEKARPI